MSINTRFNSFLRKLASITTNTAKEVHHFIISGSIGHPARGPPSGEPNAAHLTGKAGREGGGGGGGLLMNYQQVSVRLLIFSSTVVMSLLDLLKRKLLGKCSVVQRFSNSVLGDPCVCWFSLQQTSSYFGLIRCFMFRGIV